MAPNPLGLEQICVGKICVERRCGDGWLDEERGEACDDGNEGWGDGCRPDCTQEVCGDTVVDDERGEECDDGNTIEEDDCKFDCTWNVCGDGVLNRLREKCDDGALNSDDLPDRCRTDCTKASCGDAVWDTDEAGRCWLPEPPGRVSSEGAPWRLATGDYDDDGDLDIYVISRDPNRLEVFRNDGPGQWGLGGSAQPTLAHELGFRPTGLVVGEISQECSSEAAVITEGEELILLCESPEGGELIERTTSLPGVPSDIARFASQEGAFQGLAITLRDRDAVALVTFDLQGAPTLDSTAPVGPMGFEPIALVSGDFNDDSLEDLLVANYAFHQITLLRGKSGGGVEIAEGYPLYVGTGWSSRLVDVAAEDLNGDGLLDAVLLDSHPGQETYVKILLGDGAFGFEDAPGSPYPLPQDILSVSLTDLDTDGVVDLVATGVGEDEVMVQIGQGQGRMGAAEDSVVDFGVASRDACLADMNGDGLDDLILADWYTGYLRVVLNDP